MVGHFTSPWWSLSLVSVHCAQNAGMPRSVHDFFVLTYLVFIWLIFRWFIITCVWFLRSLRIVYLILFYRNLTNSYGRIWQQSESVRRPWRGHNFRARGYKTWDWTPSINLIYCLLMFKVNYDRSIPTLLTHSPVSIIDLYMYLNNKDLYLSNNNSSRIELKF